MFLLFPTDHLTCLQNCQTVSTVMCIVTQCQHSMYSGVERGTVRKLFRSLFGFICCLWVTGYSVFRSITKWSNVGKVDSSFLTYRILSMYCTALVELNTRHCIFTFCVVQVRGTDCPRYTHLEKIFSSALILFGPVQSLQVVVLNGVTRLNKMTKRTNF